MSLSNGWITAPDGIGLVMTMRPQVFEVRNS
jgi:hypothetical protein